MYPSANFFPWHCTHWKVSFKVFTRLWTWWMSSFVAISVNFFVSFWTSGEIMMKVAAIGTPPCDCALFFIWVTKKNVKVLSFVQQKVCDVLCEPFIIPWTVETKKDGKLWLDYVMFWSNYKTFGFSFHINMVCSYTLTTSSLRDVDFLTMLRGFIVSKLQSNAELLARNPFLLASYLTHPFQNFSIASITKYLWSHVALICC